mgnify:CR=1 FL=1
MIPYEMHRCSVYHVFRLVQFEVFAHLLKQKQHEYVYKVMVRFHRDIKSVLFFVDTRTNLYNNKQFVFLIKHLKIFLFFSDIFDLPAEI